MSRRGARRWRRCARVGIGGSACPPVMIERFAALGVDVVHAWGMTETSPVAVVNRPRHGQSGPAAGRTVALGRKQGRPLFGVELRAVGPAGEEIPHDGEAFGAMLVRGPCVASRYFGSEGDEAFATEGGSRPATSSRSTARASSRSSTARRT